MNDQDRKKKTKRTATWIAATALFTAINIALSSFGVPVPGGHLYICDVAICLGAILMDPFAAFIIGGVGSFLGDMIFYPAPMFVSLVTHGIQAVVISLFSRYTFKNRPALAAAVGVIVGGIIMVIGYTLGRAYVYSTPEYSLLKLPYEVAQAVIGAVVGWLLAFKAGLKRVFDRTLGTKI